MNFRNLLRNKALTLAACALVGLFLLFLLVISVIQSNTINYVRHVDAAKGISERLDAGLYNDQIELLNKAINKLSDVDESSLTDFNALKSVVKKQNFTSAIQPRDSYVIGGESDVQAPEVDYPAIKSAVSTLIVSLERERDKKQNLSKYMQIAAAILSILFLILIIFPLISRISKQSDTIVEVKKETDGIMSTVTEGLFLLTTDNEFGIEQSTSLKEMFRSDRDLEGNFFDFIANYVPQSTVQITQDYMGLLYGDRVKEKLVKDLNPLNEVEINIVRRDGSFESRFLNFKFSRVLIDNKLSHLLGSVTNVTREVMLQRELEESRDEQEAQLDLLMSILHIDNKQLNAFFEIADTTLNSINAQLEAKGHSNSEIRRKLKEISESAHRLKGDAAALGLHKFEFSVHAFEDSLVELQKSSNSISGKQLLPAVTQLKVLFTELQNMRGLVSKFASNFSGSDDAGDASIEGQQSLKPVHELSVHSDLEKPLHDLVSTLSERTGKRASLLTYGLNDTAEIPEELSNVMISSSVQFIRNSFVHGALSPEQRLEQKKTDYLNIVTSVTKTDKGYTLIVRDDGEGLDEAAIVTRAIELGFISQEEAEQLKPGGAARFIFKSGFSTKEDADIDGGRGVGLNAVYSMINKAGGVISMRHKQGVYCQFQAFFAHSEA